MSTVKSTAKVVPAKVIVPDSKVMPTIHMPETSNQASESTLENEMLARMGMVEKIDPAGKPFTSDEVFSYFENHPDNLTQISTEAIQAAWGRMGEVRKTLERADMTYSQLTDSIDAHSKHFKAYQEIVALEKALDEKKAALKQAISPDITSAGKDELRATFNKAASLVGTFTQMVIGLVSVTRTTKEAADQDKFMATWLNQNLPTLTDTVTVTGDKGSTVAAKIRTWAIEKAMAGAEFDGFKFGKDDDDHFWLIDRMEQKVKFTRKQARGQLNGSIIAAHKFWFASTNKA